MPTLKAMFRLFDGYSTTVDKINKKTDEAAKKISKASGNTDEFNNKLKATGASASTASGGLGKLIRITALIAGAVKGINIVDEFTNTSARLNLINDGLQTQAELQNKIFATANRSKGVYSDMASAISKMGLMAGEAFGSNDELIAFTELIQKGFKVGGASQTEQSSAMLQLTQAMGAGRLQGDEFRSIMENAPMIADAIAKYTGKSKGQLKEMSSQGLITADIIKKAMFASGDEINAKFKTMPMTFADVWSRIKNGGTQAFAKVMEKVNKLLNTDGFKKFLDKLIIGFDLAAMVVGWLIDSIVDGWDTIGPILGVIGAVILAGIIGNLMAMIPLWAANIAGMLGFAWPVLLVVALIGLAIFAARQMGASFEDIFGFIGGIVGVFAAVFYNVIVAIWNAVAAFISFFGNAFANPVAYAKTLFFDLAISVLGFIEKMAKGIETLLNKIPGVKVNITSNLEGIKNSIQRMSDKVKSEVEIKEFIKKKEYMDYSEGYTKGSNIGKNITNIVGDKFGSITDLISGKGLDLNNFGSSNSPLSVKGTGTNGAIDVSMADEDLQYLRDIAERDYINKFSTATLAPNISVTFGDVHEEADADKVAGRIKKILQEEIATAAEGVYS